MSKKIGRPTIYTFEIGLKICEQIATSASGLREICGKPGMPDRATVYRWLADKSNQTFRDQYARARELQADYMAEEIIELADNCRIGKKTKTSKAGKKTETETTTGDMVERSKLQVEARKWLAAKLAPKKYGDKLDIDHTTKGQRIRITLKGKPEKENE